MIAQTSIRSSRIAVLSGLLGILLAGIVFPVHAQSYSLEQGIAHVSAQLEKNLERDSVVAILDSSAPTEALALFVSQEITQFFVNSGKLVVVDRSDIEKIRKELTFQLSGDVSDESAQSIGKMLGAQIIITSTLDDMRILRVKAIAVETARILGMERVHIEEGRLYTALASDTRDNKVVEVSTADELIAAIASDRVIRIRKGRYDISSSSHIKNRQVRWVDEFDGPTPVITGVSNIAFVGEEGVEIIIKPAYGWVFSFENCSGISLSGITLGHSVPGHCLGGVARFKNCEAVDIQYCDLYGCGTIGISLENTRSFTMRESIVRDCTYGLLSIMRSADITFSDTSFRDTGEYDLVEISASEQVKWERCTFSDNRGTTLFSIDAMSSDIRTEYCVFSRNMTDLFSRGRNPGLDSTDFIDNCFPDPDY